MARNKGRTKIGKNYYLPKSVLREVHAIKKQYDIDKQVEAFNRMAKNSALFRLNAKPEPPLIEVPRFLEKRVKKKFGIR